MEQLIKQKQDKINRKLIDEKRNLYNTYRYFVNEYGDDQNEVKEKYESDIKIIDSLCNENNLKIKKQIRDIWNKLELGYNEYLKDNNKNIMFIKEEYYNRVNQLDDERILFLTNQCDNECGKDVIKLFLNKLTIKHNVSSHKYESMTYNNRVLFTGGNKFMITFGN